MRIPEKAAREIEGHCVCARCKGILAMYGIPGDRDHYDVRCAHTCPDGSGFVTKYWAENIEKRDAEMYANAKEALKQAGALAWMQPIVNKTPEQIVKELGF